MHRMTLPGQGFRGTGRWDGVFADLLPRLTALLPEGRQLPEAVWRRRHAVIVRIAAAQAVGLGVLALLLGRSLLSASPIVALALIPLPVALPAEFSRKTRAAATTISLIAA